MPLSMRDWHGEPFPGDSKHRHRPRQVNEHLCRTHCDERRHCHCRYHRMELAVVDSVLYQPQIHSSEHHRGWPWMRMIGLVHAVGASLVLIGAVAETPFALHVSWHFEPVVSFFFFYYCRCHCCSVAVEYCTAVVLLSEATTHRCHHPFRHDSWPVHSCWSVMMMMLLFLLLLSFLGLSLSPRLTVFVFPGSARSPHSPCHAWPSNNNNTCVSNFHFTSCHSVQRSSVPVRWARIEISSPKPPV